MLEAAIKQGVWKFVYCSTCGVHGNVDHPPADEDAPIQPADYYQRTKYEAEPLCQALAPASDGDGHPAAGGHLRPRRPRALLHDLQAGGRGTFPMFGNGQTLYHPLYIDNLVDAFMLCLPKGAGNGREYLIADEHYYPIQDDRARRSVGRWR